MKAYMFDLESGMYQGEVYEDANLMKYVDGITTIPPLQYGDDEVVVFDQNEQKWSVKTISEMRKLLGIVTY